jgi:hypothetical protein
MNRSAFSRWMSPRANAGTRARDAVRFQTETLDDAGVSIGAVRLGVDGALLLDSNLRNC